MTTAVELAEGGHRLVAWVAFDGTNASLANNSQTGLYQSHGVSGITDISSGQYKIHFSPAFDDTNYLVIGNAYGFNESRGSGRLVTFAETNSSNYNDSKTTGYCRIDILEGFNNARNDVSNIYVLIFK